MSTENRSQSRLLGGATGESVMIETSGRTIRPALAAPDKIVNECKLRADADGLSITTVDKANVVMIDLNIAAAAFEEYHVDAEDEVLVGLPISSLTTTLRKARKGKSTDDPVRLDIDGTRVVSEIEREYANTTVEYADEVLNLDPDSIREEPDLPDLDLTARAEVDRQAFTDAIDHLDDVAEHAMFRLQDDDTLVLGSGGSDDSPSEFGSAVAFDGAAEELEEAERHEALYSIDYLTEIADGLKAAKIDPVTITWADEFPFLIEGTRTVDGTDLYHAEWMQAPRIKSD